MSERRRYTKRQKAQGIVLAETMGTRAAADKLGIAESTVRYWRDNPKFAHLRDKTREQLAEGFEALAQLAVSELLESVATGEVESRDLATIAGIATDKMLLMSGQATSRNETRSLTDGYSDDEKRKLRDFIDNIPPADAERPGEPSGDPEGAGAEVR